MPMSHYSPPSRPTPIKSTHENNLMDVTINDDESLDVEEIQGYDPKLSSSSSRRRSSSIHYASQQQRQQWCRKCSFYVLFVLGWTFAVVFAMVLIVGTNTKPKLPDDDKVTWETETTISPASAPILPDDETDDPMNEYFLIRINCGANQTYVDDSGQQWLSDTLQYGDSQYEWSLTVDEGSRTYTEGDTTRQIMGAQDEGVGLYHDERYFSHEGQYDIHVPWDGVYKVDLFFAEIYFDEENQRVFDIYVEDEKAKGDFDIFRETGGQMNTAKIVSHVILVEDGILSIRLVSTKNYAKISGIQVESVDSRRQ